MANHKRKNQHKKAQKNKDNHKAGLPPGTLKYVGDEDKKEKINISVMDYNATSIYEAENMNIMACYDFKDKQDTVTWINIDGVHDTRLVKKMGMLYNLHPLLMEDIVDTEQRPKADFYENNIFAVVKMLSYDKLGKQVELEQVSLILGESYVLCFQEDKEGDVFDPIRERLRKKQNGKLRNSDASYLFYILLDTIVDNYFIVLEQISEDLERLEEEIINLDISKDPTKKLYSQKRQLLKLRKNIRPMREIVAQLVREEAKFLNTTDFYLRDLYDHIVQVIDNTDAYIDTTSNLLDTYHTILGSKTNDVMKVLTILSTIFMPLTFIVGVYGMNVEMPETHFKYAYIVIWIIMVAVALLTFYYFKRKKWL